MSTPASHQRMAVSDRRDSAKTGWWPPIIRRREADTRDRIRLSCRVVRRLLRFTSDRTSTSCDRTPHARILHLLGSLAFLIRHSPAGGCRGGQLSISQLDEGHGRILRPRFRGRPIPATRAEL